MVRSLILVCFLALVQGDAHYKYHEKVDFHVNTVGPANNFAETYNYFTLPWCPPIGEKDSQRLGEVLSGEEKDHANYDIRFRAGSDWQLVCTKILSGAEVNKFIDAIDRNYWFEFFVDGLSVKGPVGGVTVLSGSSTEHYLVTHLHFDIAYNGDQIIAVNITTDPTEALQLKRNTKVRTEFSFSTTFKKTHVTYEDRHTLHRMFEIEQLNDIHWLSVLNTLVMVVLLVGFLALNLVRVLKQDLASLVEFDEEDMDEEETTGWKKLHADVFRPPPCIMLLASALGSGTQILIICFALLLLSLFDTFSPNHANRGSLYAAIIFLYTLTTGISGYVSTKMYVRWGGEQWVINTILTTAMFSGPAWLMFAVCNTTAIVYGSSSALPFGTILLMLLLLCLVAVPMTVFGSWRALNAAKREAYKPPCKTNRVSREIPPGSTLSSLPVLVLAGATLSFSSIYIEVYYIFTSIWGPRLYLLFGMLAISFTMLLIVTGSVSIAATYFKLCEEDWKWQWRAFVVPSSCGVVLYAFSIYYFTSRSEMDGTLQTVFYFAYTFLLSYATCLMLGTVGFYVSNVFIKRIYGFIKSD